MSNQLAKLMGSWRGTYELWFEPGDPASTSDSVLHAHFDSERDAVALKYEWKSGDDAHKGMYLIGTDGSVAFTDSFHYSGGLMLCHPDGENGVLGSWEWEGQKWGWRTVIQPTSDALTITAWNITPEGEEAKATEAIYAREV